MPLIVQHVSGQEESGATPINALAELPGATTVTSGAEYVVLNDATQANNGKYIALGADIGDPAVYWDFQG